MTTVRKNTVSVDDLYRRSTQYRLWSYTQDQLDEIREKTHENGRLEAIKKFNKVYETYRAENKDLFDKYSEELSPTALLNVINLEEEQNYLNFFAKNILQAAMYFRMSTQVKSTALSFFKKFYLVNSAMQYRAKNVLYTCLFLAAKSENYFISIETFCKGLQNTEPNDILDLEFTVLQSLKFTLLVHHPFRPLYGFFLDFQQVLIDNTDIKIDDIGELYDKAKDWLNTYALLCDVSFLYTPPQIALAAMYDCNSKITGTYLKLKFRPKEVEKPKDLEVIEEEQEDGIEAKKEEKEPEKSEPNKLNLDILLETIKECISKTQNMIESSKEESTRIDEMCFHAINPERFIKKRVKKFREMDKS